MNPPTDDPHDEKPIEELQQLIDRATPEFSARLHRGIGRRVLMRDFSVFTWEVPGIVLKEVLFVWSAWVRGSRRRSGGSS